MTDDGLPLDGQRLVDGLIDTLDLERIEENIFRGRSPDVTLQRVFGGQVAGQALVAAGRTVPPERSVHSLHAYFIRPGDPKTPIVYDVERVRDGHSFTTRRVRAIQHGQPIFSLSASFQIREGGIDHQAVMPSCPEPESLPPAPPRRGGIAWPIDVRVVDAGRQDQENPRRIWMRAWGTMPDDPLLHVCALTFASDLTLLDVVLGRHGMSMLDSAVQMASLDHAMWFHREFRADQWFLYAQQSPSASGSRGLAMGQIFSRDGRHVASVVQEGLVRVPTASDTDGAHYSADSSRQTAST